MLPLRRDAGLLVRELPGELLVYDRTKGKAHCLNHTVAVIWNHCDGKTSLEELAHIVRDQLQGPAVESLVEVALEQLRKADLLVGASEVARKRCSRRELFKLGVAAVAAPLVITVVAPSAAMAASCAGSGASCASKPCCPGLLCKKGTCK